MTNSQPEAKDPTARPDPPKGKRGERMIGTCSPGSRARIVFLNTDADDVDAQSVRAVLDARFNCMEGGIRIQLAREQDDRWRVVHAQTYSGISAAPSEVGEAWRDQVIDALKKARVPLAHYVAPPAAPPSLVGQPVSLLGEPVR